MKQMFFTFDQNNNFIISQCNKSIPKMIFFLSPAKKVRYYPYALYQLNLDGQLPFGWQSTDPDMATLDATLVALLVFR